jgi:hypothetical protein
MLGRRGCLETSLEFWCVFFPKSIYVTKKISNSKLLMSLNSSDPLYMRGVIDYYCLRSKAYKYLITLFQEGEVAGKSLSTLPNFCYSTALASFLLQEQQSSSTSASFSASPSTSTSMSSDLSSDELLQDALIMYPMVLPKLVKLV